MSNIPRIVILDNDETTGSYYLLFSLYDLLAMSHMGKRLDSEKTMRIILKFCLASGVFRPYLSEFLKGLYRLKLGGYIDKVCIYTNQLDIRNVYHYPHWITTDGKVWSVPEMIRVMFNMIVKDDTFIDYLFTRPPLKDNASNYPVKDLVRVFHTLYPKREVNLSYTVFIDDLYHEKYIIDSSDSKTDKHSRWEIKRYIVQLPKNTFSNLIDTIMRENNIELHTHNTILRDSIESSWIHINGNLVNSAKDSKILQRILKQLKKTYKEIKHKNKKNARTRRKITERRQKRKTHKNTQDKGRKSKGSSRNS